MDLDVLDRLYIQDVDIITFQGYDNIINMLIR